MADLKVRRKMATFASQRQNSDKKVISLKLYRIDPWSLWGSLYRSKPNPTKFFTKVGILLNIADFFCKQINDFVAILRWTWFREQFRFLPVSSAELFSEGIVFSERILVRIHVQFLGGAGLPDFYWRNIPKR
jgi:hypothetical protein